MVVDIGLSANHSSSNSCQTIKFRLVQLNLDYSDFDCKDFLIIHCVLHIYQHITDKRVFQSGRAVAGIIAR